MPPPLSTPHPGRTAAYRHALRLALRPPDPLGPPAARRANPAIRAPPRLRTLTRQELWDSLALGWRNIAATCADVLFLCAFSPAMGLLLAHFAAGQEMLHLIFSLASGFTLLGPLAALGLIQSNWYR